MCIYLSLTNAVHGNQTMMCGCGWHRGGLVAAELGKPVEIAGVGADHIARVEDCAYPLVEGVKPDLWRLIDELTDVGEPPRLGQVAARIGVAVAGGGDEDATVDGAERLPEP